MRLLVANLEGLLEVGESFDFAVWCVFEELDVAYLIVDFSDDLGVGVLVDHDLEALVVVLE